MVTKVQYLPANGVLTDLETRLRLHDSQISASSSNLAASSGASLVGYLPAGTGAVATTVQSKLRESISVLDFGADPTGLTDSTTAFTNAQGSGFRRVFIPSGTYKLDNLRYKQGVVFDGEGKQSTILKQANTTNPAIYCKSDISTGQLIGVGLKNIQVRGLNSAGASAVKVEAISPYVVSFSDFDFYAYQVSTALEIVIGLQNEVYSNTFNVIADTCASTAFILSGVYNSYRIEGFKCSSGKMVTDSSLSSTFHYCVGDGTMDFGGQDCTIINASVEDIFGPASYDNCAIRASGYNHIFTAPAIINVPAAKCPNAFNIFNSHTFINPKIYGVNKPSYPFILNSSAIPVFIGGSSACPNNIESYTSASLIAKATFIGDVSTYTKLTTRYNPKFSYVNAATYIVDANKSTNGLDTSVMVGYSTGTCTLTLPTGIEYTGRMLNICTRSAQTVVSASANVVSLTGGANVNILAATAGKWANLQFDGTNWNIISNN